jgi:hypothetical protein
LQVLNRILSFWTPSRRGCMRLLALGLLERPPDDILLSNIISLQLQRRLAFMESTPFDPPGFSSISTLSYRILIVRFSCILMSYPWWRMTCGRFSNYAQAPRKHGLLLTAPTSDGSLFPFLVSIGRFSDRPVIQLLPSPAPPTCSTKAEGSMYTIKKVC